MIHPIRIRFVKVVVVLTSCGLSGQLWAQSITVVSWGGSYARASQEAYHKPFTAETGIEVQLEDYNGGLAQIRAQVEAGAVYWDVVDLELADARRGRDEGLFELVNSSDLAAGADGSTPEQDYYPETLSECGVGMLFYSTVYAYNARRMSGEPPRSIEDFFDLERFPGRRGTRRSPGVNLEFALIADGLQRSHLQRPGARRPALCHRLGRPGTGCGSVGHRGRNAATGRRLAICRVCLAPLLNGWHRQVYRLQSRAQVRRRADFDPR